MKAIVYREYGSPDVLRLREVEKLSPEDNEVLIKIHATTVNYGDLVARKIGHLSPDEFHMHLLFWLLARLNFGLRAPRKRILGAVFSGEIEAIGQRVSRFRVGDQVFGYQGASMGAYAEHLCMSEDGVLAPKPGNMSFEEAAVVPYGSIIALNLFRKVDIRPGQNVLINGASGGIGSFAVQLAKHYGAEVTGVCGSPRLEFVKSLGADKTIDYTKEDFTQRGDSYDLILDILGKSSFSRARSSLKENGRYLFASFKTRQLAQMIWTSIADDKKVICTLAMEKSEDLLVIKDLVEAGKIRAVIDRRFPFEHTADAHRYVENGHNKGHVVITVAQNV